jgi:hypothetical protein
MRYSNLTLSVTCSMAACGVDDDINTPAAAFVIKKVN